jgi:hypothetical protein
MKSLLLFLVLVSFGTSNLPAQIFTTSLRVTVRDGLGNIVEGATVKAFEKKDDYMKEVNVIESGITDKEGVSHFKKLKPINYFILCRKGDKNNNGGGVETKLVKDKLNEVTIVIQ